MMRPRRRSRSSVPASPARAGAHGCLPSSARMANGMEAFPRFSSAGATNWWQSLPRERQGTLFPEWTSTAWSLMLLRAFGLEPASAGARRAVRLVREHCRWEHDGEPFFAGEVEPCINGRTVAIGGYFGEDVEAIG